MKILLTGANGYIGMRMLPLLLESGHQVVCCVRNRERFAVDPAIRENVEIVEVDFLKEPKPGLIPPDIDAAYYLIHSMSSSTKDFDEKEARATENFNRYMAETQVQQVIYLSGIVNEENLSKHLWSRKNVEEILYQGSYHLTVLRAGIIVGSGSSSFEIIRDLCEKLPFMIAPKWINTPTQPIGIRDVLQFLTAVLGHPDCYNESFDIGGPNVLTYKQMLQLYAKVRNLPLSILTVPVMTPRLSSYWLYFVTSTSYTLAQNLVDSMRIPVVTKDKRLQRILGISPMTYTKAIELAFIKIDQNQVVSSWKDSMVSGRFTKDVQRYIRVPSRGCMRDHQSVAISSPKKVVKRIWKIGGETGWYYADWIWQIRGFLDTLVGGVGLRRGRTHPDRLDSGDALDFWRVLMADKKAKRLLLFAEMKVPGEAWLEFNIDDHNVLHQTATFRPKGLMGRLYWYSMLPFHYFIFRGMIRNIAGEH